MIATPVHIDLILPPPDGRSPGIHQSAIVRNIAIENKILTTDTVEELSLIDSRDILDPVALARIGLGIGWERYYIPEVLSRRHNVLDHPPEIEYDGVFMSMDGESVSVIITSLDGGQTWINHHAAVVHEVKCTYKSIRTVAGKEYRVCSSIELAQYIQGQWMWMAQIKAYCIARKTRFAVLHVLFVCGDYSYPMRPVNLAWQLEFSQEELDSNWELLRDYKDHWLAMQARENDGIYRIGE